MADLSSVRPVMKMFTNRIAWAAAIGMLVASAPATASDETVHGDVGRSVDAYLTSVEAFGFAGAVLVEQDGVVLLRKGYGLADRSAGVEHTPKTRFDIGSISKQFTAAIIMRLVERGVLDLETTLSAVLPEVPEDKASITLRHLLSHSSGLPYHASINRSVKGQSLDELVPIYLAQPLRHEPGARFSYSNPGYTLLAAIAEKVSGTPFPQLLQQEISDVADLSATGHVSRASEIGGPWARAYLDALDVGAPYEWPPDPEGYGAGGVVSTIDDLSAWMKALQSDRVLTTASVDEMWRTQVPIGQTAGYGFGWFRATTPRGTEVVFHQGDYQGFNNDLRLYRDEGRLIILLSNARLAGSGVREVVMHHVATIAARDEATMAPPVVGVDREQRARHIGTYMMSTGGELVVTEAGGGVRVESLDAAVIDWMSTREASEESMRTWADLVTGMMNGAMEGDFQPVRTARHRAVVVRGGPTELEVLVGQAGESWSWESIGSCATGPEGGGHTFVQVNADGTTRTLRFTWMDDALLGIEEASAATIELKATGPDAYAWFDLFTGGTVTVRFDADEIHLRGGVDLKGRSANTVPSSPGASADR